VTNLGHNDLIIGNRWMKEHGAIPVPTTQEVWFIGGHCRHPGAAEVIPWPEGPQKQTLVDLSRQTSDSNSELSSEDSEDDINAKVPETEFPSEIRYVDDII